DQDLLMLGDPAAGGELADEGLVELAPGRVVDGLEARLAEFELGLLEGAREALVLAGPPLGVDEEGEAFVEAEGGQLRVLLLGGAGRGRGGGGGGRGVVGGLGRGAGARPPWGGGVAGARDPGRGAPGRGGGVAARARDRRPGGPRGPEPL